MSDDIAKLGFEIDTAALTGASKAADQAAVAFDKMGVSAEKVEQKTKGMSAVVKELVTAEKQAGDGANKAATDLLRVGQEAEKAGAKAKRLGADLGGLKAPTNEVGVGAKSLIDYFQQLQPHAMKSGDAIADLTQRVGFLASSLGQGGVGGLTGGLSQGVGLITRFGGMLGPVGGAIAGVTGGVAALAGASLGLVAATGAMQDRYALLEARLKNVYGSASVAKQMFGEITVLADKNAVAIDQAAESFLRLARNNEAIGLTRKQMVDLTDSVQMLGRVSGASTGELASGMMQFSQALASGRLNGDELRSIMENMPALAKAIADGMGVSVGQIRAMGAEGQLTGDKITAALLKQMPKIRAEFEGLPQTTEQAFTRVDNAWNTMLANMGKQLNSSGIMQGLARGVENTIRTIDGVLQGPTVDQQIAELRALLADQEKRGITQGSIFENPEQMRLDPVDGEKPVPTKNPLKARLDALEYDRYEQSKFSAMADRSAAEKEARDGLRAPYVSAGRIFDEVDPVRKRVNELNSNIASLDKAWNAFAAHPELFNDTEAQRIQRIPGYISTLKKEIEGALPALDKFMKGVNDNQEAARRYGTGGGVAFGTEVRKLEGTMDASGAPVSRASAESAVMADRIQQIKEQTAAIAQQADAERARISVVGTGRQAEIEAEASAKAYALQLQLVGKVSSVELPPAIEAYKQSLIELSKAQEASAGQASLLNGQFEVSVQRQLAAAQAAGANAGQLRELEQTLRRIRDLEQAVPSARPGMQAGFDAADIERRTQELQRIEQLNKQTAIQSRLAAGMSPPAARKMQQEQDARQFSESFAPAQQEAAYQSKLNQLRTQDAATIRQQLSDKQRAAELTAKEIEATKLGGLAAQVRIARERELNAIKSSGLALTVAEVEARLKLAEQAVLDQDALSKAQRTVNAYSDMWTQAGQAVASGLEGQFEKMLDGQRFKLKEFLGAVAKDIAMAIIRAQITQPIANLFSDIGSGSLGNGTGAAATGAGGIIGSIFKAFSGGGTAPVAANTNAPAPYSAPSSATASVARVAASRAAPDPVTASPPMGAAIGAFGSNVARTVAPPAAPKPAAPPLAPLAAIGADFWKDRYVGRRPLHTDMDATFETRLQAAILDAEAATGGRAKITSLARTNAEQTEAYNNYRRGGGLAAAPAGMRLPNGKIAPGSRHELGMAADIASGPELDWLHDNADDYGLEFLKGKAFKKDPVHIQLKRGSKAPALGGRFSAGSGVGGGGGGVDEVVTKWSADMKAANENIAKTLPKTFDPPLKDVASNFAKTINVEPVQKLTPAIQNVTEASSKAVPSLGGLGSGIGNLFSSLFQGIGSMFGLAHGGVMQGGSVTTAYARGATFSAGSEVAMSSAPMRRLSAPENDDFKIVRKPTLLPMKRGKALIGEAGPEAVMPMRRGPDGRMGVVAVVDGRAASIPVARGGDGKLSLSVDSLVNAQAKRGAIVAPDRASARAKAPSLLASRGLSLVGDDAPKAVIPMARAANGKMGVSTILDGKSSAIPVARGADGRFSLSIEKFVAAKTKEKARPVTTKDDVEDDDAPESVVRSFAHGGTIASHRPGANVVPFARGGVPSAPSREGLRIANKPTLFPMARGLGLVGEAGPEAIIPMLRGERGGLGVPITLNGKSEVVPLRRGISGKTELAADSAVLRLVQSQAERQRANDNSPAPSIARMYANGGVVGATSDPSIFSAPRGVQVASRLSKEDALPLRSTPEARSGAAAGGGGGDGGTQVVINDMRSGGSPVEAQQERGPDGKRMIRLTIRDEVKAQMRSGTYDSEMAASYGSSRVLVRR